MKGRLDLITILTNDVPKMVAFYRDVLGFQPKDDLGDYVEFKNDNIRFAICAYSEMYKITQHVTYTQPRSGQALELALLLDTPQEVDRAYAEIVARGATPVTPPANMPWGHRAAFFADPDGNIHELFAVLSR
jgi:lactoylglutathione lyase